MRDPEYELLEDQAHGGLVRRGPQGAPWRDQYDSEYGGRPYGDYSSDGYGETGYGDTGYDDYDDTGRSSTGYGVGGYGSGGYQEGRYSNDSYSGYSGAYGYADGGMPTGPGSYLSPSRSRDGSGYWGGLPQSPKARARRRRAALMASVLAVLLIGGLLIMVTRKGGVVVPGITEGGTINPGVLGKQVKIALPKGKAKGTTLTVDGKQVPTTVQGDNLVWEGAQLGDGKHSLTVAVPGLFGSSKSKYNFKVDAVPPRVDMPPQLPHAVLKQKLSFEVGIPDKDTKVSIGGKDLPVTSGKVKVEFPSPPAPTALEARDPAGNVTTIPLNFPVNHPDIRGVHVRGVDWADAKKRQGYLKLLDEKKINVIELDIKDENGHVVSDSQVPLAKEAGVVKTTYKMKEAIDLIHSHGGRVVGRIVAFSDGPMSDYLWDQGKKDMVLQDSSGNKLKKYNGFLNYVNPQVQNYVLDLAKEGASNGFDEILWDYMRRPEGEPSLMKVPGLGDRKSADIIVEFLGRARNELRPMGVYMGVSVFGVAVRTPDVIAQNIPQMAKHVDYVAPMVYPSHWGPGEYGVANPIRQPYDIVKASMKDFQKAVQGTDAKLVLWTQDFSDKEKGTKVIVHYGQEQVRAQLRAINDIGINSFLLWNAESVYTTSVLDPKR